MTIAVKTLQLLLILHCKYLIAINGAEHRVIGVYMIMITEINTVNRGISFSVHACMHATDHEKSRNFL